jgi:AraC-like DNA-binding protein
MTNSIAATFSLRDITDQRISVDRFTGAADNDALYTKPPHRRDDHFLFIFQKSGKSKVVVDFNEIAFTGSAVLCVLPGQLHYAVAADRNTEAWLITLDSSLISDEYKAIFEEYYFQYSSFPLAPITQTQLNECIELVLNLLNNHGQLNYAERVLYSLIDAMVGMFASGYTHMDSFQLPASRKEIITRQFKRLLLQHFKTHKSSSAYAPILNITPAYLNEAVKSITGFTVSFWIEQIIIAEAKRLLYATDRTVKEIAFHLGFEDHAYFSRYFSRATGLAPLQFRATCRK